MHTQLVKHTSMINDLLINSRDEGKNFELVNVAHSVEAGGGGGSRLGGRQTIP
jgi:hypothetical protein